MEKRLLPLALIFATALTIVTAPTTQAAVVTATGTNPESCNQSVSSTSGVSAQRISQECVVTFTNTSEVTWTVPAGVSRISAVIVGGGGGGGDSLGGATGGGGGPGGYFQNSNISISGSVAIASGAGGGGSALTTQGDNGGTSYIGTLKVGGGGGGNGANYAGGARARAGVGGSDFLSSGGGGGGRPTGTVGYTNEYLGGLAGDFAAGGIIFMGNSYSGIQGLAGGRNSDGASGGLAAAISPSSNRTSAISGGSVEYSKASLYRAWEDAQNSAGTKTPGSGGSPNYSYGTDVYGSGGAGANGIVIIRYTISSVISAPAYEGPILKGTLESMTVTINVPGKVRFFFDGKRIPTCLAVSPTGTAPNYVATCTWRPTVTGTRSVHATLSPSDGTTTGVTSARTALPVVKKINLR